MTHPHGPLIKLLCAVPGCGWTTASYHAGCNCQKRKDAEKGIYDHLIAAHFVRGATVQPWQGHEITAIAG